ncbi:MAG: hypothetical protein AAGA56_02510, partial [Myxococcota bacterium]
AAAAAAIFALRGIYFALLEAGGVPVALTGTAVGVVSVFGYTPDVLLPAYIGALTDAFPGQVGHRIYFATLAGLSVIGLAAAHRARRHSRDATEDPKAGSWSESSA